MQDIANEYVAFLDYIGKGNGVELIAREDGGFNVRNGILYQKEINDVVVRDLSSSIVERLKNPKSRVSTLRQQLEKFKKQSYYLGGFERYDFKGTTQTRPAKTEKGFNEFLEDYYEDDATSTGTSQGSSVDDLTNTMGRMDLSGGGFPSVEQERQDAMRRPFIQENIADYSDIFRGKGEEGEGHVGDFLQVTGLGEHKVYGEQVKNSKLTEAQVNQIRLLHFRDKVQGTDIAKEFKVRTSNISIILSRKTWKHLPQVEGEPDKIFNQPNIQEMRVMKLAKEYGVEPVRNKIGRLALPQGLVRKLKAEKQATEPVVEKTTKAKKSKKTKQTIE
jgi:hypothetical protein